MKVSGQKLNKTSNSFSLVEARNSYYCGACIFNDRSKNLKCYNPVDYCLVLSYGVSTS